MGVRSAYQSPLFYHKRTDEQKGTWTADGAIEGVERA